MTPLLAMLALLVATPTGGSPAPTMDEAHLAWKTPPTARDMARRYPVKARVNQQFKGLATVMCTAKADGALNCDAVEQAPQGFGFGDAAVGVMSRARVKSTDGGSPDGRSFVFTLKFGRWTTTDDKPQVQATNAR